MSRRWWVLLGALAIATVVLGVAWATREAPTTRPSGSPTAGGSSSAPSVAALPTPSPSPTATPTPTPTSTPAPSADPTPPPASTRPPRASGPPRLAYAQFLARINDDRSRVETLNTALSTAAQAQDPGSVRAAAVDILDFVDSERDWLRDNPPADCYAAAHASAGAMLDAYGAAADAFITWAETGGGFAGLGALGEALDAAQVASDSLTTFGTALEATTCPA